MGSEDRRFPDDGEGPVRQVIVSEFGIACFAVSNLQFGDFVRATAPPMRNGMVGALFSQASCQMISCVRSAAGSPIRRGGPLC
jgi:formylglycine-generating enzyme required for sulfatase activity